MTGKSPMAKKRWYEHINNLSSFAYDYLILFLNNGNLYLREKNNNWEKI